METTEPDATLFGKTRRLESILAPLGNAVVAYSGGVDSTYLGAVAHDVLGRRALMVTAVSPSLSAFELRSAKDTARRFGWNHVLIETSEVSREEYARNAPDRCYWCKSELFEALEPIARTHRARICVGTNLDDLSDLRPGLRAARERGVLAPMVEAALTKADIRSLSREKGLPTADKPASPCLASRFAYGVRVTEEALNRIERAEEAVRGLGFEVFRVRDHGDLARVEVEPSEIERAASVAEVLTAELKALGWRYVTLDLAGFRSGSMNEVLAPPRMSPD
ncbi:MAG: ATP-dependent sacrificial sulfur transferase LarE [Actinomycetota bacterium]|nr:ATP-dependent sacrificial sulfur transferase LarE [Actinomycetota bacterium]